MRIANGTGASRRPGVPSQPFSTKTGKKAHVKVTMVFFNGAGEVFDPEFMSVSTQSGNEDGEMVQQGDLQPPKNNLLPEKKVRWSMGFGVDDPTDVTITVSMSPGLDDVTFTNMQDYALFTHEQ